MTSDEDHEFLTGIDGVGETVAEALLVRYGSAEAVLDASESGLRSVPGVGETTAKNITQAAGTPGESRGGAGSTAAAKRALMQVDGVGAAVAERLVERFGSVETVLRKREHELTQVDGVGPAVASRLTRASSDGPGSITVPESPPSIRSPTERALDDRGGGRPSDDATRGEEPDADEGFTVQNMVYSGALGLDLELDAVVLEMPGATLEESDRGGKRLVYDPPVAGTVRVTERGKLLIAGVASEAAAEDAVETLNETLDAFDPKALRPPNDAVHERVDELARELGMADDPVAAAHELVDEYDDAVPGNARGDDGKAAMAVYLAADGLTQSTVATAADVSSVTIRNITREFRDRVDGRPS
ncbi:helix-hairpin-helix domain-containing protein [Natronomonas sp. EA1]|uniref:helix-hairpin-helix domain-containing protein n=1 Tax=Natronomonas sp. EA1 TaxID=3421655 RepID=UPI003EBFF608